VKGATSLLETLAFVIYECTETIGEERAGNA